jgi:hypothetical protein
MPENKGRQCESDIHDPRPDTQEGGAAWSSISDGIQVDTIDAENENHIASHRGHATLFYFLPSLAGISGTSKR